MAEKTPFNLNRIMQASGNTELGLARITGSVFVLPQPVFLFKEAL